MVYFESVQLLVLENHIHTKVTKGWIYLSKLVLHSVHNCKSDCMSNTLWVAWEPSGCHLLDCNYRFHCFPASRVSRLGQLSEWRLRSLWRVMADGEKFASHAKTEDLFPYLSVSTWYHKNTPIFLQCCISLGCFHKNSTTLSPLCSRGASRSSSCLPSPLQPLKTSRLCWDAAPLAAARIANHHPCALKYQLGLLSACLNSGV